MSLCIECMYKHEAMDDENVFLWYDCHNPNYFCAPEQIQPGEVNSCEYFVPARYKGTIGNKNNKSVL